MKIQTLAGFEALDEGRWNALLAASAQPSVFMTWQWQNAWLRAFGGGRPLQVLAASDATESLVALLPLHEAEAGLWRIVGGVDVSDYLDLIAAAGREEEAWEALLQHRAADRSAWHLRGIRAESPTAQRLPGLPAQPVHASTVHAGTGAAGLRRSRSRGGPRPAVRRDHAGRPAHAAR